MPWIVWDLLILQKVHTTRKCTGKSTWKSTQVLLKVLLLVPEYIFQKVLLLVLEYIFQKALVLVLEYRNEVLYTSLHIGHIEFYLFAFYLVMQCGSVDRKIVKSINCSRDYLKRNISYKFIATSLCFAWKTHRTSVSFDLISKKKIVNLTSATSDFVYHFAPFLNSIFY